MNHMYKILMAASVIGAGLVTGGILPVAFAAVFASTGTAAAFFHEAPGQK